MLTDKKRPRDAFSFSRSGMRAIASFGMAAAIADDVFRRVELPKIEEIQEDQPLPSEDQLIPKGRFWLSRRRRAA